MIPLYIRVFTKTCTPLPHHVVLHLRRARSFHLTGDPVSLKTPRKQIYILYIFTKGCRNLNCQAWTHPMLGRCLSPRKGGDEKKALNAILFIAAAWALNTGTHSFEEAEGGGTLAKRMNRACIYTQFFGEQRKKILRNDIEMYDLLRSIISAQDNFACLHTSTLGARRGAHIGFLRQHIGVVAKPAFEIFTAFLFHHLPERGVREEVI